MWKGVVLVSLVALAVGVGSIFFRRTAVPEEVGSPEEVVKPAPEFPRTTEWLQSEPLTLASLRGQVVIVHFWTNGCLNCIHNYPVYKAWQKKYASNPLT